VKLLLVSANRERSPYPVFPIGLAYLAGPLATADHDLRVIDLCFSADPVAELRAALGEFSPHAVIVSIRNMDNVTWPGSRSYLAGVREIVATCRAVGTVILGGSGFSLMPYEVLDFVGGDYGIVGEGEEVLVQLLQLLEGGEQVAGLPGVLRRGEAVFPPPRHLERIGKPDRSLFDVQRYRREGGMANVQTKRGCPFGCIYCTYPNLEGTRVRTRPVPEVVAELRELAEAGIDYIYFVDDIFNYPVDYALQLCRAIRDDKLAFNWSAFINPLRDEGASQRDAGGGVRRGGIGSDSALRRCCGAWENHSASTTSGRRPACAWRVASISPTTCCSAAPAKPKRRSTRASH